MIFTKLPKNKPFRFTSKDLTVFQISENNTVLVWFRDLQAFVSLPQELNSGWFKKLKRQSQSDIILVDKLPKL